MKTLLFASILFTVSIFSQSDLPGNLVGNHITYDLQRGSIITTNPVPVNPNYVEKKTSNDPLNDNPDSVLSNIRYTFIDPVSIGTNCAEAGNGLKSIVGWYLNNERVSAYDNSGTTPLWEFTETPQSPQYSNFVGTSSNGSVIANSFNHNFYSINGTSGTANWTFDLTTLPYTVSAGPIVITSSGNFIVAAANGSSATDSSTVFGFSGSNVPVWSRRIGPTGTVGSQIYGAKISGNDSLVIVNTYITAYVIKTYTGQLMYSGTVNPLNNNGTQSPQGISGNGNIIATINYGGYVRVLQWNGSTYNLLWQHQEPPGTFFNWMTAVDVTNDGSLVACGTLNFISNSNYDGKVKLFSVSGGSTPLWTSTGDSDEVNSVAFSKNGRFLCSGSWGSFYTGGAYNLKVFKTTHITNIPWFKANSIGSFECCGISDDGQAVIGTGKKVHARAFGNGGILYNLAIDTSENLTGINSNQNIIPDNYSLSQNYPNPFNPSTKISYDIPKDGLVRITVFDVTGREINTLVNKFQRGGRYSVSFDGMNLTSGIYFYRIEASGFNETRKMVLIK